MPADHEERYPWKWWISDNEEHYTPADTSNREDTIEEGRALYGADTAFYILEAYQGPICLRPFDGSDILEAILNANEDNTDDDGELPQLDVIKPDQEKQLANAVNDAVEAWFKSQDIDPVGYRFAGQRNGERIEAIEEQGEQDE